MMTGYWAVAILIGMVLLVAGRARQLGRQGVQALHFGKIDRTDFVLPPLALGYFYLVAAGAFGWPSLGTARLIPGPGVAWVGVGVGLTSLGLLAWTLVSFGRSFRVGIDLDQPGPLVTTGSFAFSRNPIYVAMLGVLLGQFLIYSSLALLAYVLGAAVVIHRQVRREEAFLRTCYGEVYQAYCRNVRRYL